MEGHCSTPESGEMPPEEGSGALSLRSPSFSSRSSSPGPRSRSAAKDRHRRRRRRSVTPDDDEAQATLYVDRLASETTERGLRAFFMQYGTVLEAKVMCVAGTGQSRGFGFVTFGDAHDADNAVYKANRRVLDGSVIRCNKAKHRALPSLRHETSSRYRVRGRERQPYDHSASPGRWEERHRSRSRSPYPCSGQRSFSKKSSSRPPHLSQDHDPAGSKSTSPKDHRGDRWAYSGGATSSSSSRDSDHNCRETAKLREDVKMWKRKAGESRLRVEEIQLQLELKQKEIDRLKAEHSTMRSKMQTLSETHDRRGTLLVKALTALRHQHELKKRTAKAEDKAVQMMEDALKMAEEWNQHCDVGLGLESILKDEIDLMDMMGDHQSGEEQGVANGKGGWKPLSFRLK